MGVDSLELIPLRSSLTLHRSAAGHIPCTPRPQPCSSLDRRSRTWYTLEEVKRAAAERWVAAVNADGTYEHWEYAVAKKVADISDILEKALRLRKR